jgi:hypothetical protein
MIHALQYAKILAVSVVRLPARFLFWNDSFITSEGAAVVVAGGSMGGTAIVSYFFISPDAQVCLQEDRFAVAATFGDRIVDHFPDVSLLYSLFRARPNVFYGQPPCQYCVDACEMYGRAAHNVVIVSEDFGNPCIAILVRMGARHAHHPLWYDLGSMLRARRVILARGTFGLAVMYISIVRKFYYPFRSPWIRQPFGSQMECEPTPEYEKKVLGWSWANSPEQRHAMMPAMGLIIWKPKCK